MTAAEKLIEQGRAEGNSLGLSRQRNLLRRLLELKFGALSPESVTQLETADETTIERYAERFVTATMLSDVLGN